ncbi:MAG TPA: molybdopterin molybdenumtransferase MoeA, partial [Pseudomonas sp.]|nr:molybdopterin molybdenumtransferase MoeA [Pseudomonas sp.]
MSACGCESGGLLPVEQAIAQLLSRVPKAPALQRVPLEQALGRVLAEDILSPLELPAWNNSAMDGYALRAADLPAAGGYLPVTGRVAAGEAALEPLPAGQVVRIFTGAPLPAGADTVVPQERCRIEGEGVWLPPVQQG